MKSFQTFQDKGLTQFYLETNDSIFLPKANIIISSHFFFPNGFPTCSLLAFTHLFRMLSIRGIRTSFSWYFIQVWCTRNDICQEPYNWCPCVHACLHFKVNNDIIASVHTYVHFPGYGVCVFHFCGFPDYDGGEGWTRDGVCWPFNGPGKAGQEMAGIWWVGGWESELISGWIFFTIVQD